MEKPIWVEIGLDVWIHGVLVGREETVKRASLLACWGFMKKFSLWSTHLWCCSPGRLPTVGQPSSGRAVFISVQWPTLSDSSEFCT